MKGIENGLQMSFLLLELSNYFMYYVGSRTLANTLEMNFILLGMGYFLTEQRGIILLKFACRKILTTCIYNSYICI